MGLPGLNLIRTKAPPSLVKTGLVKTGLSPVAVDFGVTALKLLQVTLGEPPALIAASCLPTPDALLYDSAKRLAFQVEHLPKLIRKGGFKGRRAVCVIPSERTFCKHLQLGRADGLGVRDLLNAAIPAELGCPASALVLRHHEVEAVERQATGGKTEVICMATPREVVMNLMSTLRAAKFEPVGMHNELTSLVKAFDGMGNPDSPKPATTLYLDLGWTRTRAVIAHESKLEFARCVEVGGRALDETVAHQKKYELPQARNERLAMERLTPQEQAAPDSPPDSGGMAMLNAAMRKAHGPAEGGDRAADLSDALDMLKDEVAACLRYHESLFPTRRVEKAVFVGGEARHRALCQHLARSLRLAAQVADPMARVARTGSEPTEGVDFTQAQPGWAVALGACLSPTDL